MIKTLGDCPYVVVHVDDETGAIDDAIIADPDQTCSLVDLRKTMHAYHEPRLRVSCFSIDATTAAGMSLGFFGGLAAMSTAPYIFLPGLGMATGLLLGENVRRSRQRSTSRVADQTPHRHSAALTNSSDLRRPAGASRTYGDSLHRWIWESAAASSMGLDERSEDTLPIIVPGVGEGLQDDVRDPRRGH